jgi:hypothetical protein
MKLRIYAYVVQTDIYLIDISHSRLLIVNAKIRGY